MIDTPKTPEPPRGALGRWRLLNARLPAEGESVLFFDARTDWVEVGDLRSDGHFWTDHGTHVPVQFVTHWQPLKLPTVSSEDYERIRRIESTSDE